jgi:hypothetical protein
LGNNPCLPYDLCVKEYSGLDADVVHWEQSYNCGSGDSWILELFIRQAMHLPNKPIIVLSESDTANWYLQFYLCSYLFTSDFTYSNNF